ncbi:MAG TPA: helix-turn-helix domain-containing protein [Candidatus Brocadiia bacterium]|nr:helix-turn-helix domain-containing protein [Candidatus Brocadiia bacterium]
MPNDAPSEKLLLGASDVAEMLSVATVTIWRSIHSGRIPAPVRIGGRTLWRREELEEWIRAGCPPRMRWQWPSKARS